MSPVACAANLAWAAANLPAHARFRRALGNPSGAQAAVLRRIIREGAQTAYGREHRFETIRDYADYAARVPLRDYGEFEPYIERIRRGEPAVLTGEPVTCLATTGGTTGGRKLIPYTKSLQAEFNAAVSPWIVDLFRAHPGVVAGSAYWSISPVARRPEDGDSAVPVGFEEDGEYLGGVRKRLVDAVMAVPPDVRHAPTVEEWRRRTIGHLSRCRDLRLISVWHPSFLSLLVDHLPKTPAELWPKLRVVSCWTDGHSSLAAAELARRLPGVTVQPKGLIATEGIVSIPFAGRWPLAVTSHFLEFIEPDGTIRLAHQLKTNETYEVALTTSGGLYRYRLHDLVRVDGFVNQTPSIRFVGKTGQISDRFGEKLSEAFVGQVLRGLANRLAVDWTFAMLAPCGNGYTLFVEGAVPGNLAALLDAALGSNPHYAYCRDLGQLTPPRIFRIRGAAQSIFEAKSNDSTQRLGDHKFPALSPREDWEQMFDGDFHSS